MPNPRLLYLDAYDSFSYSIISLLQSHLGASVSSVKIDDPRLVLNDDAFLHFLSDFDAVVAGPGPGHPANFQDVGLISKLWALSEEHCLPVLGICLGFQSLCLSFGAEVERLREPRHGLVTPVTHCHRDLFEETGEVLATQYHSLYVRIGHSKTSDEIWTPTKACYEIEPLAWDLSDAENGPIFMAAKHRSKPFWGVQYHPESICTNEEGKKLVRQWWREVCAWKALSAELPAEALLERGAGDRVDSGRTSEEIQARKVHWKALPLPKDIDVVDLGSYLCRDCDGSEPLLLESGTRNGTPVNAETGRFSIVGVQDASSTHIRYFAGSHRLQVRKGDQTLLDRGMSASDVFEYLERFTVEHKAGDGPESIPFWGGLVGFVSYEASLETIDVRPADGSSARPDIWFVFVERSLVVDHERDTLYVQSLADDRWVEKAAAKLEKLSNGTCSPIPPAEPAEIISAPVENEYRAKVHACQSQLRAGESYELCLTDTTQIHTNEEPWTLYRRLRDLNPAPFGAYLSFSSSDSSTQSLHIASSSPERFFSWSRDGECQFRPIKGTVKRTADMTRAKAEEILRSPKEQAENLMIVDLIRHDLSGVKGVSNVEVPKLMSIEEYTTVYQLVSVITGHSTSPTRVLAASLPPGSMTGAPKKRSCELLRAIEGREHARGVYSGVIGYLDVGGGGDFSVAIRTAFRWSGGKGDGCEGVWNVGAGGAVTVLSDDLAEWEEMITKRESALRAFGLAEK